MGVLSKKLFLKYTRWADKLLLISTIFTCTYFIYRDFGVRMIFGYMFLGGCLGLHLIRRFINQNPISIDTPKALFLLLAMIIGICVLRPDSNHDYDSVSYLIAMIICTIYLLLWQYDEKEAILAKRVFLYAGIAISIFVLFFTLFPDLFWNSIFQIMTPVAKDYLSYYVPKGYGITLGGVTYTDYILYCAYVVGITQVLTIDGKKKYYYIAACLLFVISIFFSGRRSELLALIGATVILYVLLGRNIQVAIRRVVYIICGVLVAFLLLVLFLPSLKSIDVFYRYTLTIENLFNGYDISSGRFELYALAISVFLKHPVIGIGWRQYSNIIPDSFLLVHGDAVKDVHCIYLQFLCETGIIGFLIIVPVLFFFIYHAIRLFRLTLMAQKSNKTSFCFSMISLLIQLFLLLIGFIDPCFTRLIFWNFYSIAIMFLGIAAYVEKYEFLNQNSKLHLVKNQIAKLMNKLKMIHK